MNFDKWCEDYAHQEFERLYLERCPEEPPPEKAYSVYSFWRELLFAFLAELPHWCVVLGISILIMILLGVFE